jgi:leucyl-tRNA synthetase
MVEADFAKIEKKWQDKWAKEKVFEVKEESKKKKYYVLEMFPYPSGSGLHMGHAWNYTIGDIIARFKKMCGFNVLHPMGYDALGLPAENAAIEAGTNPADYTDNSIKNFIKQQTAIGLSYDWSRLISSASPSYYRWDQWIFLKMLEKGLAYQKESSVNWCPKCNTVLANEQVQDGKCWRHEKTNVEVRHLKQWFLKITDYADELYEEVDKLDWPEKTKAMQKNWIGKSYGTEIDFEISKFGDISKKEFVFLHAFGDSSQDAFWSWLKKEIENRKGKVVFMPNLPNTNSPKLKEQLDFVQENYTFKENTVVVGHSLGNILMMKILEKIKIKIAGLVMVGAPLPRLTEEYKDGRAFKDFKPRPVLADYCDWKFNFKTIKEKVDKIVILEDENDHIVPRDDPKKLAELLDAEYILSTGNKTHFNGEKEEKVLNCIFEKWPVFTTRPDTIYGVTFMVVSAQHKDLMSLVTKEQKKDVEKFLKSLKSVSEKELADMEKEGVFTGSYATNPATGEKVPVYAGNFVVADYGAGMVMAVPAHDQRDFEFAKKYGIAIKQVVCSKDPLDFSKKFTGQKAFVDEGILMNSKQFSAMSNEVAKKEITNWLIEKKVARSVVNFRLRDWGISRQRYWGTPIPIIHCDKCGAVPVPEKDLPVELPKKVKFGEGNPLETNKEWIKAKCPKCGGIGRRETETMDTFVNSSWYFLRYCDPKNNKKIFDSEKVKYWCPIDTYIGGAEHACMHLIYFRFYTKFLADIGLINFREPAKKLFHQGMLRAEGGEKMSKSKGNVVLPETVSNKYGIDTARFFLSSLASPDKDIDWSENGVIGSARFTRRLFDYYNESKEGKDSSEVLSKLNQTIKNVTEYYETFQYRKATIEIRELFDAMEGSSTSKETKEKLLKILSPICPHITEELWEKLGGKGFISTSDWPGADEKKILKKGIVEDLNGKLIDSVKEILGKVKGAKKVYLYVMPFEISKIDAKKIEKALGKPTLIFAVNDSKKYDPENKAKKAKPGMASIYVE